MIDSVVSQAGANHTLYVTLADETARFPVRSDLHVLPGSYPTRNAAIGAVLDLIVASHLIPIAWNATLAPGALSAYARAIEATPAPESCVIYADEDERDARGKRRNPWFKPEWDDNLFLAQDYLSAACAIPVAAARPFSSDIWPDDLTVYALLARMLLRPDSVACHHLPFVATTRPEGAWSLPMPARSELLRHATGLDISKGPFGTITVRYPVPTPPAKVSLIVPTRDRLDLLETCVTGVLTGTDYPDIERIIADNDGVEPQTLAFFARCALDVRVKVVRWPHPYNYSAVNNFAVAHASGSYVCLLNNDTEVFDPAWLREMMAHASRPGVGAVGARLLYPDRSIQHAGVVVGMGNAAGHAHRGLPKGDPGYFAQALVAREATAVTAACLVIARDKFDAVAGLDEDHLAIAYNDVDFCLKLRRAGWRNMYVPQAVMIHHESKSRGLDFAPEHLARYRRELAVFQDRWNTVGYRDPTHHPALDIASEVYRIKL